MSQKSCYSKVKDHILSLAVQEGRDPNTITLIAVSKNQSLSDVMAVYNEGCHVFGENRIQEALEKIPSAPKDIQWHFIGTLQSNKVKKAVTNFSLIHSVDTLELAERIAQESATQDCVTDILLQVNTSGELTKHGLSEEQWYRCMERLLQLPEIRLRGLMTMAPLAADENTVRSCFSSLRKFRDKLNHEYREYLALEHLSMGMSNDYPWAIAEGATLLRLGKVIFSENPDN